MLRNPEETAESIRNRLETQHGVTITKEYTVCVGVCVCPENWTGHQATSSMDRWFRTKMCWQDSIGPYRNFIRRTPMKMSFMWMRQQWRCPPVEDCTSTSLDPNWTACHPRPLSQNTVTRWMCGVGSHTEEGQLSVFLRELWIPSSTKKS